MDEARKSLGFTTEDAERVIQALAVGEDLTMGYRVTQSRMLKALNSLPSATAITGENHVTF
jgi:hypothetical protein